MKLPILLLPLLLALLSCTKKPAPVLISTPPGVDLPEYRTPKQEKPLRLPAAEKFTTHFDLDSYEVRDLEPIHAAGLAGKGKSVRIVGHACPLGSDDHNLDLSRKRAEAVRRLLVFEMDLDPQSVTVDFKGEADPITTIPAEYEKNRRAEIFVKE